MYLQMCEISGAKRKASSTRAGILCPVANKLNNKKSTDNFYCLSISWSGVTTSIE